MVLVAFIQCTKTTSDDAKSGNETVPQVDNSKNQNLINKDGMTLKDRISVPDGYDLIIEKPGSFGAFIQNFKLKPFDSPILKYDGTKIATQNLHVAVLDIDTGNKDLQQCADAIIRLRAEYLFATKNFDEIKFHFTSGDLMRWNDYKNGTRAFVNGNKVSFKNVEKPDASYTNFRNYLDLIFTYAGTISLAAETKAVLKTSDLKTGDILINAGSPGHAVFIAGVAKNENNKKLFLLGEGFTPAQSIHILKNPYNQDLSPWYELNVDNSETSTARYHFKPSNFRTF